MTKESYDHNKHIYEKKFNGDWQKLNYHNMRNKILGAYNHKYCFFVQILYYKVKGCLLCESGEKLSFQSKWALANSAITQHHINMICNNTM